METVFQTIGIIAVFLIMWGIMIWAFFGPDEFGGDK